MGMKGRAAGHPQNFVTSLLHLFLVSFGFPWSFLKSPSLRWGRGLSAVTNWAVLGNAPKHWDSSPDLGNCFHGHRVIEPAHRVWCVTTGCGVAQGLWDSAPSHCSPMFTAQLPEDWSWKFSVCKGWSVASSGCVHPYSHNCPAPQISAFLTSAIHHALVHQN